MKTVCFIKMTALFALCLCILGMAAPAEAHAGYLDPGSGSIVVQTLVASMVAFAKARQSVADLFRRIAGREE